MVVNEEVMEVDDDVGIEEGAVEVNKEVMEISDETVVVKEECKHFNMYVSFGGRGL